MARSLSSKPLGQTRSSAFSTSRKTAPVAFFKLKAQFASTLSSEGVVEAWSALSRNPNWNSGRAVACVYITAFKRRSMAASATLPTADIEAGRPTFA
jgi:hypothetical protein